MPAETGLNYIVQILISSTYTPVAQQRGGTLNLEADGIDATSKDDNAWSKTLPGRRSWSIDVDGLIVIDDTGYTELVSAFQNQTALTCQVVRSDGKVFRGSANITSFPHEFPYDDAATYSVTLAGEGSPTKFWEAA